LAQPEFAEVNASGAADRKARSSAKQALKTSIVTEGRVNAILGADVHLEYGNHVAALEHMSSLYAIDCRGRVPATGDQLAAEAGASAYAADKISVAAKVYEGAYEELQFGGGTAP
jgi:hypothetical protein